jgi:putative ABC transport system ATP-binding protein
MATALHPTPLQRLVNLLAHERRDLAVAITYSVAIGLLSLATPIAVQALVNTVAFGTVLQPLVVLAILVLLALCAAGVLQTLRMWVVETIQRRVFIRLGGEVAEKLLRVRADAFDQVHGPELVNRFLDAVTVQKSVALLLVDGLTIAMQALIGLILLAVYHPLLLAFDVVLLLLILVVLFGLGRGAIRTSIEESRSKYEMVAWLEELARHQTTFRSRQGAWFARERTTQIAREYISARRAHFRVVVRQAIGSYAVQALATSALLGVGGYLVISGQLTLGQLIAAELVVGAVVGGFAKFHKSLESYYDLLAAVDKIGYLQDLPTERGSGEFIAANPGPAALQLCDVGFAHSGPRELIRGVTAEFGAGKKIAIHGRGGSGKSTLLDLLYALRIPTRGTVQLDGYDYRDLCLEDIRAGIALVRDVDIFPGSLLENVRLGLEAHPAAVREALEAVGLLDVVGALSHGLQTQLATGGAPLTPSQSMRLMVARALLSGPRVLLLDEVLDRIDDLEMRGALVRTLFRAGTPWTLIVTTERPEIWPLCDHVYTLSDGVLTDEQSATVVER